MARRRIDLSAEGGAFGEISLANLVDSRITQIRGYVTSPFGDPIFKLTAIDFASGEILDVEGEHDCPYLVGEAGNHNQKILAILSKNKEENNAK